MSSLIQCVIHVAPSISEQSSKSKTAHGTSKHPGYAINNLLTIADTFSKAREAIWLKMLALHPRFSRHLTQVSETLDKRIVSY